MGQSGRTLETAGFSVLVKTSIALLIWTASSQITRRRPSCSRRKARSRVQLVIRPLFQAIFSEFGKPGTSFSMTQRSVDGDYAYILWSAETADNVYEMGTDTFVVRNSQIIAHSFAGKIRAKG